MIAFTAFGGQHLHTSCSGSNFSGVVVGDASVVELLASAELAFDALDALLLFTCGVSSSLVFENAPFAATFSVDNEFELALLMQRL